MTKWFAEYMSFPKLEYLEHFLREYTEEGYEFITVVPYSKDQNLYFLVYKLEEK